MAGQATQRVAMLSIHPTYASAIMDGAKCVEFRRRPIGADVHRVVVYATAPVKRVIGAFEVTSVDSMPPELAWQSFGDVGAIDKQAFDAYYSGAPEAFVIRIGRVIPLDHPLRLADLDRSLRPPQSFVYLREALMRRIETLLDANSHSNLLEATPA